MSGRLEQAAQEFWGVSKAVNGRSKMSFIAAQKALNRAIQHLYLRERMHCRLQGKIIRLNDQMVAGPKKREAK